MEDLESVLNMERGKAVQEKDFRLKEIQYIGELVEKYKDELKELIDPNDEFNSATLAKKSYTFVEVQIKTVVRPVYFGIGSFPTDSLEHFDVYTLGWLGADEHQIKLTQKGFDVAKGFYDIRGYEEQTWFTPVPNNHKLIQKEYS